MSLIEPIVAPILPVAAGSGAAHAEDTGQGFDFSIGGLLFNIAPGVPTTAYEHNPYVRQTAPFRKDQLDTSATPGDQSLIGYWTRGQFSFHHGAGVTYYEVEQGDEIISRFNTGIGIDPFVPGKVTLAKKLLADTDNAYTNLTWAGATTANHAVLDSGVFRYGSGALTGYVPSAGTVVAATVGPLDGYVATTAKNIERVKVDAAGPASAVLYSHTNAIKALWYAKDRLILVDDTNTFYQLTPNPTGTLPIAIPSTAKVFTSGDPAGSWLLTDSPGAILISSGQNIYAVVPDTSGTIPVLSGPIIVGQLPRGETLTGMMFYLGFLAMATTAGIRIGILSDAGSLTYGPLLVTFDTFGSSVQVAARGSSVYVACATGNTATQGVYRVDLSQQIGNGLEFGYCRIGDPNPTASGRYGLAMFGNALVMFSGSQLAVESATLTNGSLTTGFHRFGTLEAKQFRSVAIRVAGAGGTVQVSRVMADGSTVSLYTLDVAASDGQTITLGLSVPLEMVALRFDLFPSATDPTTGPTLLGYQLNALPSPTRQRLINVPLLCFDVEARQPARRVGHTGYAWERLAALEDMERSGGTFIFQDFRTGESGECFIEQIDFKNYAPPSATSTGFGGLVVLTLRKL